MRILGIRGWILLAWLSAVVWGNFIWNAAGYVAGKTHQSGNPVEMTVLLSLTLMVPYIVGGSWFLKRMVLKPLAATSYAARRIAGGDLDFDIPPSRVKEVAEVSAAFHTMGDALRESLGRQAKLEQERRLFISAIAHDLRTPLFSLRGYLEGLEQGLATTPQKEARYISVCREKADDLEHLIEDLFAYARLQYLEQAIRREPLEIGELLSEAVEKLRSQAKAKDITLRLEGPKQRCVVWADAKLLERAMENLLNNALRYTPKGGNIQVSWVPAPDYLLFSVSDTGPGISPEDLPHVFAPMYRGDASRNAQTGGSGLGLTIARDILVAHGGDLTAANQESGGAEFTGHVPYPWKTEQWPTEYTQHAKVSSTRIG